MIQLCALTSIQEYNVQFQDVIIHNCPCYKKYEDFKRIIIENDSYYCCIAIQKEGICKILHLKLPVMFGSLIDFSIRGPMMDNYSQFGCLYLDGGLELIYNFISNNLGSGHVYNNRKKNTKVYNINMKNDRLTLKMTYDPSNTDEINSNIDYKIRDLNYERNCNTLNNFKEADKIMKNERGIKEAKSKSRGNKSKLEKNYEKCKIEFETKYDNSIVDTSEGMQWIDFINAKAKSTLETISNVKYIPVEEGEYIKFFDAALSKAPKLDHLANKVGRTCAYILKRALEYSVNHCFENNPDLKNLNTKVCNIFKNGNMYLTLSNADRDFNFTHNLMSTYRCIYQRIEAQKFNLASNFCSVVKRSTNEKVKNSLALMFPHDGKHYTCYIDSREMKGAGENVMLSQLVIIPIATPLDKVVDYLDRAKLELMSSQEGDDPLLTCVINSLIQPFKIRKSKLILIKRNFPILNLMIFDNFLVINTNGYIQMKYSVKYEFFINSFEYLNIWPDAFDNYHPHLMYNSIALHLSEMAQMALPAKLTVANANVRGRCAIIENETELNLFLHSNGTSNAALVHVIQPGDKTAYISFDGIEPLHNKITIPLDLKNPQLRYSKIGVLGKVSLKNIPVKVREFHDNFKPIEDTSEGYGLALEDLLMKPKRTTERIREIINSNYVYKTRLEFVDTHKSNMLEPGDTPLIFKTGDVEEQLIYSKMYNIRCYIRDNQKLIEEYNKVVHFDTSKKYPPHIYVPVAFGDVGGGTNEDGIIIDKKLVESGPKKLLSQTLKITYKYDKVNTRNKQILITYKKMNAIDKNVIIYGCIESNVPLKFKKTKNTLIKNIFITPLYLYFIIVDNISVFDKYITSTFLKKECTVNIHYSYIIPLGVGTKISTGHGQKGVISKVADLSHIHGYRKDGTVVHPLVLISPTSILGRTMASQVMSMFTQKDRALTKSGVLIASHGFHIHHLDPSSKTKMSTTKNDLMTTENGFVSNMLAYTMKILADQKNITEGKHQLHFIKQLIKLQGSEIKLVSFQPDLVNQSI
ncbi:LEF-8 [Penaeus monodon nudivirus]|uniref:DNA-directed RNA polymerase n=1 Tax=Penaeus monodon nudivirus TaxID=1529056 RepID=A0A076FIV8_9VIRU|nr:LEF-8 [Penaeus monodon nudivirus]AII15811.1 LEF-8 [Penaeus monodon nudivirus]